MLQTVVKGMLVGSKGQSTQTQVLLQDVTALHSWLNKYALGHLLTVGIGVYRYHLCALGRTGEAHRALLKEAGVEEPDYSECLLDSTTSSRGFCRLRSV